MNKRLRILLVFSLIIPLTINVVTAQEIQMKKWVIGSGGMVSEKNSEGLRMSGIIGQLAIEKLQLKGDVPYYDMYQGFWVPEGIQGTDVPEIPVGADLRNFPNPFSTQTTIEYTLPGPSNVTIKIYNVAGNVIKTLNLGVQDGTQKVSWDAKDQSGTDLSSGSYLLELNVDPTNIAGYSFSSYTLRNMMIVVK